MQDRGKQVPFILRTDTFLTGGHRPQVAAFFVKNNAVFKQQGIRNVHVTEIVWPNLICNINLSHSNLVIVRYATLYNSGMRFCLRDPRPL